MYIAKKISLIEKIKRVFSKKYRERVESEQMKIIREMVTTGKDEPIMWK